MNGKFKPNDSAVWQQLAGERDRLLPVKYCHHEVKYCHPEVKSCHPEHSRGIFG